jgi:uncharacterized protein
MTTSADGALLSSTPPEIETWGGQFVDILIPRAQTITHSAVARGLAYTCRYGGHVRRFYSVAEHSILVRDLLAHQGATPVLQRAGLLHDAPEAFLGDVVAPLKWALRDVSGPVGPDGHASAYDLLTERMERAIADRFDVPLQVFGSPDLATADLWALRIEAAELTWTGGAHWRWTNQLPYDGRLPPGVRWRGNLSPDEARIDWLDAIGAPANAYDPDDVIA